MRQQAALAYQQVAKQTVSPRDLEANLLSRSAGNFQRIRDNWDELSSELYGALMYNRKLWMVFLESANNPEHALPQPIRQNVANLALFIFKHTISIQARPEPHKLNVLININREIAAGLRSSGQ